jgi:hypothetical protein
VTGHFIGAFTDRSPRETAAATFLDLLSLPAARNDYIGFASGNAAGRALGIDDARATKVLPIPGSSQQAVDPGRSLSQLLIDQVNAFRKMEQTLPPDQQTHIDISQIKTEKAASAYFEQVMLKLQPKTKALGGN